MSAERQKIRNLRLTWTSATTSCSSASARALISDLLITLLKSETNIHSYRGGFIGEVDGSNPIYHQSYYGDVQMK